MMHPHCRTASGELPTALTPVYPTMAGLPQAYLRKAVLGGLAHADLSDTLPAEVTSNIGIQPLWDLRKALSFLHHRRPTCRWRSWRTTATRLGSASRPRNCWPATLAIAVAP